MSNNLLLLLIFLPIITGTVLLFFKNRAWGFAAAVSAFSFILSVLIFFGGKMQVSFALHEIGINLSFKTSALSSLIIVFVSFFTLLIVIYSQKFMDGIKRHGEYYGNILITLGSGLGIALSSDLIMLVAFWGLSGFALYQLINVGTSRSADASKKSFIILGGTDALMIFGVAIIWLLTGTFDMSAIKLTLDKALPIIAYFTLASAALAKAGAIPFHTWITDSSEVAPVPVMAYLPAALDKLLGIYLFARISMDLFVVVPNSIVSTVLMVLGSLTIILAVMAALIQHNLKKLLAFHAVSQVGYMILGIGSGIPVGIAGGLFHMLNNAIYKCSLFLGGGVVEREEGTSDLNKLGGLAAVLPVTFITMLIAAFAISGVPPFNGFVSKWMIYQGIISLGKNGGSSWIIYLTAAMFGSALTLASFMKIINATFLGKQKDRIKKQVPLTMLWPMIILGSLNVIFGIFAFPLVLKYLLLPIVPLTSFIGSWSPIFASLLMMTALGIGAVIYLLSKSTPERSTPPFIGGENIPYETIRNSGVSFYDTIRNLDIISDFYDEAKEKTYDLYEQLKKVTFWLSDLFKWFHNGLLHTYLAWCLLGLVILMFVFFRGI